MFQMKLILHHVCFATVDFDFVGIFLMLIFLRCRVNTDERTNKMFKGKSLTGLLSHSGFI